MELQKLLSNRTRGLKPSPIRKLVPLMRIPGMISFGGGYPNPETFAFSKMDVKFRSGREFSISNIRLDIACQYGPTDANADLRPFIQDWHAAKDGIKLTESQIQILNGSQEGLHIMAYLFLEPGDSVVVSEPSYPGALGAFRAFSDRFLPVPLDSNGTVTSELERLLEGLISKGEKLPKFIYEVPNGHNPAGVSLSLERRRHLLQIASRFDLIVLEDDPYQLLLLEDKPPIPTLQSLDSENRVIRLDSFSKIFAPGLRIGYASGPAEIINLFQLYKQGSNLHTSSMVQSLLAGFFETHAITDFRELIRANCRIYRANRDCMLNAAKKYLPPEVKYNIPGEGMFIWFQLPERFDADRMVETDGLTLEILMVPGSAFSTTNALKNCMRASYSMVSRDQIDEGMQRFAQMIDRERDRI
jgi:DNA-binding transcriptional MocR family regulator